MGITVWKIKKEGDSYKFQYPKWQIYLCLGFFITFATVIGVVFGYVLPNKLRNWGSSSSSSFGDTSSSNNNNNSGQNSQPPKTNATNPYESIYNQGQPSVNPKSIHCTFNCDSEASSCRFNCNDSKYSSCKSKCFFNNDSECKECANMLETCESGCNVKKTNCYSKCD